MVRDAIRKGDFTKGQRDVTLALVNTWFHHRGGPKGYIHPGRKALAKKAGVCVRTAASTLAMLRASGVCLPIANLKGGQGAATRYKLNLHALLTLCGCDWLDTFMSGYTRNCTVKTEELHGKVGQKLHTVLKTSRSDKCLSQEGDQQ